MCAIVKNRIGFVGVNRQILPYGLSHSSQSFGQQSGALKMNIPVLPGFMVVQHYANCEYCAKSTEFEIIKKKIHATFLEIISKSYQASMICQILRFNSAQVPGTR